MNQSALFLFYSDRDLLARTFLLEFSKPLMQCVWFLLDLLM